MTASLTRSAPSLLALAAKATSEARDKTGEKLYPTDQIGIDVIREVVADYEKCARPDRNPLFKAVMLGRCKLAELFHFYNPTLITRVNKHGRNAMYLAALIKNPLDCEAMVKWINEMNPVLIDHYVINMVNVVNLDPHAGAAQGAVSCVFETPLSCAAADQRVSTVALNILYRLRPDQSRQRTFPNGWTPLHLAVYARRPGKVRSLLELDPTLANIEDNGGFKPLKLVDLEAAQMRGPESIAGQLLAILCPNTH